MSQLLETENWKLRVGHLKPAEARVSSAFEKPMTWIMEEAADFN